MKTRLFDASSIMLLTKRQPKKAPDILEGEYILDLTKYEVGNAVWKLNKLIDTTDASTAIEAIEQVHNLTALMEVTGIEGEEETRDTMKIAYETGLSFYDSAYLSTACARDLKLVTEDGSLVKRAKELGLDCLSAEKLTGHEKTG